MKTTTARTPEARNPNTVIWRPGFTPADLGSQKPRPPTPHANLPMRPSPETPSAPSMQVKSKAKTSCWLSGDYPTDYTVSLSGVAEATAGQMLQVNHTKISLNPSEYLVALVLVCHALRTAGKQVPVKVAIAPFLSAADIAYAMVIYCETAKTTSFSKRWDAVSVSRLVYTIRRKLARAGLNKWLVQNDDRGRGLRLGTPPANVSLIYLDTENQQVVTIDGSDPGKATPQD
ncbi:MAG: hypothetical protein ACP5MD_03860 [Verrucomicrobiia bacterium]